MRNFIWEKKGLVFSPDQRYDWMQSYAQKPTVLVLENCLRILFATRPQRETDGNYTSLTTFIDVDKENPNKIQYVHNKPILALGTIGTFDQFAVVPGCVIRVGATTNFYYIGWMRGYGIPYSCAIGLAQSHDDGMTFSRFGEGPMLDRTFDEPYFIASANVVKADDTYHLWYSSGTGWISHQNRIESLYVLKHATSVDGINWQRDGKTCIKTSLEQECQAGPTVLKIGNQYHMWFCYRNGVDFRNKKGGYRIGYAWSDDLYTWNREDERGNIHLSNNGWDSQMLCYPNVVKVNGKIYMFYCGNDFGKEGFGFAQLKR